MEISWRTKHAGVTLTFRETIFLRLVCEDIGYEEIAARMEQSRRTVEKYRDELFKKLGARSRTGLVLWALKTKFVKLSDIKLKRDE